MHQFPLTIAAELTYTHFLQLNPACVIIARGILVVMEEQATDISMLNKPLSPQHRLSKGDSIPRIGFGSYKIRGEACTTACLAALDAGYRHIDSAQLYRNEARVGEAIKQSDIPRQDIFITTKIGKTRSTPEETYQSAVDSVTKLAGEDSYVDLFLIHIPGTSRSHREELWGVLEKLKNEGKAKFIGVSNFRSYHIEEMKEYATLWPPAINQIELHPWCQQRDLVKYCQENSILIEAYSPLVTGKKMNDPTLLAIAEKHSKSPAQVLIRYSIQKDWVTLPKSKTPLRIEDNLDVFAFVLDKDDMKTLDDLDEGSKGACFPMNVDK